MHVLFTSPIEFVKIVAPEGEKGKEGKEGYNSYNKLGEDTNYNISLDGELIQFKSKSKMQSMQQPCKVQ